MICDFKSVGLLQSSNFSAHQRIEQQDGGTNKYLDCSWSRTSHIPCQIIPRRFVTKVSTTLTVKMPPRHCSRIEYNEAVLLLGHSILSFPYSISDYTLPLRSVANSSHAGCILLQWELPSANTKRNETIRYETKPNRTENESEKQNQK